MKTHITLFPLITLAFAVGCEKDQPVNVDRDDVTTYHDQTVQLSADQACKWETSDSNVAVVSTAGLVTGVRLGQAIITATSTDNGSTDICTVHVDALSHLYVEPYFSFNAGMKYVYDRETRTLAYQDSDILMYYGENSSVRFVGYMYEYQCMKSAIVLLNTTVPIASEVTTFLGERYPYYGSGGGFHVYKRGDGSYASISVDDDLGLNVLYTTLPESKSALIMLSAKMNNTGSILTR